jgi:Tfp pilus assembly protein PilO
MFADWQFELRYVLRHPRVRAALMATVMSMAILLLVVLAYWLPARHASQSLADEIDHYRLIAHDKRYSAELAVAAMRASAQVAEAEKKLDQNAVQSVLVQHLSQLAKRHGLRILTSNYDEGKAQDGFQPTSHELTVQGGYSGLRGFLADIPSLPTLTVVEDCSITRNREGGSLKATMLFRTWRRSGGPEAAQ